MKKISTLKLFSLLFIALLLTWRADAFAGSKIIKVLTYNIAGLPKKINKVRFKRIKEILEQRKLDGTYPDVLLFQEAFTEKSQKAFRDLSPEKIFKGPRSNIFGRKIFSSGTYIVSDHEFLATERKSYRGKCAGWDCFANKGIAFAKVKIDGIPFPIDIVTTHMQSNSKVSDKKASKARKKQIAVIEEFFEKYVDETVPMILAGDINLKPDNPRKPHYGIFKESISADELTAINSGNYCLKNPSLCKIDPETKTEEIYEDTHDHQFFRATPEVKVEPVFLSRNFREVFEGDPLSDHYGYEVHYKISW